MDDERISQNYVFSPRLKEYLGIIAPIGLCIGYLCILYFFLNPSEFATMMGLIIAYLVPPAGKETVIPLGIVLGLPWWLVAFTMAFFDIIGGLFMVLNFTFALRIPVLGDWIQRMMSGGREYFDERPWLERLYFFGLILFVMVPFEGSGGISASIIGRLMGMGRWEVLVSITAGACISCFAIALGADYILMLLARSFFTTTEIIIVLFLMIGFYMVMRYAFRKHRSTRDGK